MKKSLKKLDAGFLFKLIMENYRCFEIWDDSNSNYLNTLSLSYEFSTINQCNLFFIQFAKLFIKEIVIQFLLKLLMKITLIPNKYI